MIKRVGVEAKDLEKLFIASIYLDLQVRVQPLEIVMPMRLSAWVTQLRTGRKSALPTKA